MFGMSPPKEKQRSRKKTGKESKKESENLVATSPQETAIASPISSNDLSSVESLTGSGRLRVTPVEQSPPLSRFDTVKKVEAKKEEAVVVTKEPNVTSIQKLFDRRCEPIKVTEGFVSIRGFKPGATSTNE